MVTLSYLREQTLLADDACQFKVTVMMWLTDANPRLLTHDKTGRGLYNNTIARLICPVEFD